MSFSDKIHLACGGIAQLGERLNGIQEVSGSIPLISTMKRDIRSDVSFHGGDKRDRTADLLNAIQALSQLSYTPTGKVYLIRKRHECQERFCILAKKSARRTRRRAEGSFTVICASYMRQRAHASQSWRTMSAMAAASFLWPSGSRCSPSSALICATVPASRKRRPYASAII